jgi:hypothetical protein
MNMEYNYANAIAPDEKMSKIRGWLSAPDSSSSFRAAIDQRQAGTGAWFLESKEYAGWRHNPRSILWLYGIPGCGKTILSASIVEDMLQRTNNLPGSRVAYYYFTFNDHQKQDPRLMLCSLVSQLSLKCRRSSPTLDQAYSSKHLPTIDSLLDIIREMVESFPHSYVILDALDECSETDKLMTVLEKLVAQRSYNLHFLATSRRERGIERYLEKSIEESKRICLQSEVVDPDIRKYAHQRLSTDARLARWRNDIEQCQEIEARISHRAQGM